MINYKLQIYSNQIVNCWSRDIFYEALWSMFQKFLGFFTFFCGFCDIFVWLRLFFLLRNFSFPKMNFQWKKSIEQETMTTDKLTGWMQNAKPYKEVTKKPVLGCQVGFPLSYFTFSARILKRRFWIHKHGQVLGANFANFHKGSSWSLKREKTKCNVAVDVLNEIYSVGVMLLALIKRLPGIWLIKT